MNKTKYTQLACGNPPEVPVCITQFEKYIMIY